MRQRYEERENVPADATQWATGLEFAHECGIVHRDLKPVNVWLTSDGVAKIGDFGLAVVQDRSCLTEEGMMVGTVSHMPLPQAMGGAVTSQSDLYSLGAMLYELVTGRPPFLGDESVAIIGQHINTPPGRTVRRRVRHLQHGHVRRHQLHSHHHPAQRGRHCRWYRRGPRSCPERPDRHRPDDVRHRLRPSQRHGRRAGCGIPRRNQALPGESRQVSGVGGRQPGWPALWPMVCGISRPQKRASRVNQDALFLLSSGRC